MTVTDQLQIIDNKIKPNQAQYDLHGLAANAYDAFYIIIRNQTVSPT